MIQKMLSVVADCKKMIGEQLQPSMISQRVKNELRWLSDTGRIVKAQWVFALPETREQVGIMKQPKRFLIERG